jgi:hypothetical protein
MLSAILQDLFLSYLNIYASLQPDMVPSVQTRNIVVDSN